MSRQAVVKNLQVLETVDLVEGARAGREVLYSLRPGALDASARWLAGPAASWERRLASLKREAETSTSH